MNVWMVAAVISGIVSRVPVDSLLSLRSGNDLDRLEHRLRAQGLLDKGSGVAEDKTEYLARRMLRESRGPSLASTDKTVGVLRRDLAKELYRFQIDLGRGCKIAGEPCDCCEKHPILGLEALTEELIPMDPTNPVYEDINRWIRANHHKLTAEASASGKYDSEYPLLASDIREFRKQVLGTESLMAMLGAELPVPAATER
jgi:hypothetical protein